MFLLPETETLLGSSRREPNFSGFLWELRYCFPQTSPVFPGLQFTDDLVWIVILVRDSSIREDGAQAKVTCQNATWAGEERSLSGATMNL